MQFLLILAVVAALAAAECAPPQPVSALAGRLLVGGGAIAVAPLWAIIASGWIAQRLRANSTGHGILLGQFQRFGGEFFVGNEEFLSPLTAREMEILGLVVQGQSNREIAYGLGISHQTVKNHMTAILRKLGATGRTEAAVSALRRGWIPLRGP